VAVENYTELFDASSVTSNLKHRVVRGGAATIAGQAGARLIQLLSTMILARILVPEDFGLIAMILVVTGFIKLFQDLGLSMATVQRKDINHGQISTLFWITIVVGLLLAMLVAAMAPGLAWFYGEPKLVWLTVGLSGGFILSGFITQQTALLRRHMRLGTLAVVNVISLLIGDLVGILAALAGAPPA
jgi:O-antigen/teichoic acid export membrane protein